MKILVFEYMTGGGFCNQELPETLLEEGCIMLRALVEDLLRVKEVELYVPLDRRLCGNELLPLSSQLHIIEVAPAGKIEENLSGLIDECDAVWPVAPESDNILAKICKLVEERGKRLLSSSAQATELTGNKFKTVNHLKRFKIPAVSTEMFLDEAPYIEGRWVLKPVDGVGCEGSYIINGKKDFQQARSVLTNSLDYIIQPYMQGKSFSLSCLFNNGRGWLLCCNYQDVEVDEKGFLLRGCQVNVPVDRDEKYRLLVERIAHAIPGLWGYAGIDLIETEQGPLVMEINPRLTTSYAGLREALGMNIAEKVLHLIHSAPEIDPIQSRTVKVTIPGKQINGS